MTFISLCLISICIFICSSSPKQIVKRFIDAEQIKKDPDLKKQVDNNNGAPLPIGQHAYLVVFMKKPKFDEKFDANFSTQPTDFSTRGPFFASGALVSRRWAITRAKPIAYYPVGSYWMVAQRSIRMPVQDALQKHDVDTVMIHPDHKPGDLLTEIALVRTAKFNFDFETRSANLAVGEVREFADCQLPVWSWHFPEESEKKGGSMDRGQIALAKSESCGNGSESMACLSESGAQHRPCGINAGAPIICGPILMGVYVGDNGDASCNTTAVAAIYHALILNAEKTKQWIEATLADPDLLYPAQDTDDDDVVLIPEKCPSGDALHKHNLHETIFVIIFFKYMI